MTTPTRKRPRPRPMTDAQVADRQREAAAMRIAGSSWPEIAAAFGLSHQRWARDIVAAAIRKGMIRESDLPEPLHAALPTVKGSRWGPTLEYDLPSWVDPNWRARAACHGQDLEPWFPVGDNWTQGEAAGRAEEAKAFCDCACPVIAECLADAIASGDDWSIRGATTPDERRALRQNWSTT